MIGEGKEAGDTTYKPLPNTHTQYYKCINVCVLAHPLSSRLDRQVKPVTGTRT